MKNSQDRTGERGQSPQQFLEELLGDNMAMEAEQGLQINESDHQSAELGQESEASSASLALGQNSQAPQDTVLELKGNTQALQERKIKCEELLKENRQLRDQVAHLRIELQMEKNTSDHLKCVQEELEGQHEDMLNIIKNEMQGANEKQCEELGEHHKQLNDVREALLREKETNALLSQENEWLQQEVARLNSLTKQLHTGQEELLIKIEDLQVSLENEKENFHIFRNMYYKMIAEQRSKETDLPRLSAQCKSLTLLTKELEEERGQLWTEINSVKQLSKTLLEEHAGSSPQNKGSLNTTPEEKVEEEEKESMQETKEAHEPEAVIGSLNTMPEGKEEEEEKESMQETKEAHEPEAVIGSLNTTPEEKVEEEEKESMQETKEAHEPEAVMRKRRSPGRALAAFFRRKRHGSRGKAKCSPESAPGSPEATPASSGWLEHKDTPSEHLPKATGQQKSAFWSRKKKDKVKDQPPRASWTLSNLICCCYK